MPYTQMNIASLPPEILLEIFARLSTKDILVSGQVCRAFRAIAFDPLLWTVVNLDKIFNAIVDHDQLAMIAARTTEKLVIITFPMQYA